MAWQPSHRRDRDYEALQSCRTPTLFSAHQRCESAIAGMCSSLVHLCADHSMYSPNNYARLRAYMQLVAYLDPVLEQSDGLWAVPQPSHG